MQNLVPFPRLHFLVSSLAPLYALADVSVPPRRLNQLFSDAFSPTTQLLKADPKRATYLAYVCPRVRGLELARGGVGVWIRGSDQGVVPLRASEIAAAMAAFVEVYGSVSAPDTQPDAR